MDVVGSCNDFDNVSQAMAATRLSGVRVNPHSLSPIQNWPLSLQRTFSEDDDAGERRKLVSLCSNCIVASCLKLNSESDSVITEISISCLYPLSNGKDPIDNKSVRPKMLTCITCSKQLGGGSLHEPEDEDTTGTPSSKQAIKPLTFQIKDMALKASGAYRHCKPCSVSERFHCSYRRTGAIFWVSQDCLDTMTLVQVATMRWYRGESGNESSTEKAKREMLKMN
uniref:Transcription factor BREVIS RADIX N-terminal domain-containing protein n=1 Tax=Nelumbo nucifera TaxID=4432 RepID=A0A822XGX7_NELNU|nr:TPA_asm: hypothetical protein HUJ06_021103 [Nelumbo nucifera]